MSILNAFLTWLPNFLRLLLPFHWLQLLPVQSSTSCSTFIVSLYINSCILASCPIPFARHFCLRILPRPLVRMHVFSLLFNYYIWSFCCNFSVWVYRLIQLHCNICHFRTLTGACVFIICLLFQCLALCTLSNANVHKLDRVSLLLLLLSYANSSYRFWDLLLCSLLWRPASHVGSFCHLCMADCNLLAATTRQS